MDKNKLKEGVLCSLKMSRWAAYAKLDPDKISKSVPKEIIKTSQDLILDKSILKKLTSLRSRAKYILVMNSLPFPIENVYFIPKEKIEDINRTLTECENEIKQILDNELLPNYNKLKHEFRKKYPKFYQKDKYPSKSELKKKFQFSWIFFQLDIPDKKSGILPPSLYRREKEKFQNMVSQMEEMTVNMIGNLLYKRIKTLETQCENGSINAATVQSVENFITKWEDLWEGHIDQVKFKNVVNSLRREMNKTSIGTLKDNDQVRINMGNKLGKIIDRIQNIPNIDLKRRLII